MQELLLFDSYYYNVSILERTPEIFGNKIYQGTLPKPKVF